MNLLRGALATDLQPGDQVLGLEAAGVTVWPLHEATNKGKTVELVFLNGFAMSVSPDQEFLVARDVEHRDVEFEVDDPRDRADLREAEEARKRAEAGGEYFSLPPVLTPSEIQAQLEEVRTEIARLSALVTKKPGGPA